MKPVLLLGMLARLISYNLISTTEFVILLLETEKTGMQSFGSPTPPLPSCVTLAKLLCLSVLPFPYIKRGMTPATPQVILRIEYVNTYKHS